MVRTKSGSGSRISIGPKRKIGFVCSGGGSKAGAFHLGVALALQEQGFQFFGGLAPTTGPTRPPGPMEISTYVGSSAGSIIATFLAAGYTLDNIFDSFLGRKPDDSVHASDVTPKILPRLTYQKMFKFRAGITKEQVKQLWFVRGIFSSLIEGNWEALLQFRWLKASGIFSTVGIENYLRDEVLPSNRFQDYLSDLFIVATQLNHSRKVVFGKYSYQPPPYDLTCQYDNDIGIAEACAASAALPVIFAPYPIKNKAGVVHHYIDGEIRDTLSTHVAADAGCDLIFASYTHQPYHLSKEIGSLAEHGIPSVVVQSIYLVIEQKINNDVYNRKSQRAAIDAVWKYCKESGVSEAHTKRIMEILESELHHRRDVERIYIHPDPKDAQIFFGEHFSLSSKKMADVVRSGFRAAIDTLRKYDFADRKPTRAIGIASSARGSTDKAQA